MTRFERFKKWAKENIAGVSAVTISVAGIITTVVMAGRKVVKQGMQVIGKFGKVVANLAKKAGPRHSHYPKHFSTGTNLEGEGT